MADPRGPIGVLVLNVGTPDAPGPREVRRYLREFLSDPRVLDLHPAARWALLNLVILPFRPRRSAEAYRAIWGAEGSPLLVHGRSFASALEARLGPDHAVALGMRYGRPSVREGLRALLDRGATRVVAFPLFPQYASSTTGTALEAVFRAAQGLWNVPSIACVPPFFDDDGFVGALGASAAEPLGGFAPEHTLFSFHGLPERHIRKSDPEGRCLASPDCCARLSSANRFCYRAQCFETARRAASALGLAEGSWSVAFQSRLGRDRWIGPATDRAIAEFPERGVRRLAVICPSFVADCLETLEEIGIRGRETFRAAGGEELLLVPCLNATQPWVEAAAGLVRRLAR